MPQLMGLGHNPRRVIPAQTVKHIQVILGGFPGTQLVNYSKWGIIEHKASEGSWHITVKYIQLIDREYKPLKGFLEHRGEVHPTDGSSGITIHCKVVRHRPVSVKVSRCTSLRAGKYSRRRLCIDVEEYIRPIPGLKPLI